MAKDEGVEAWLPQYPDEPFYGVDRSPVSFWTKAKWGPKERITWRWYLVRAWVARNILRLRVE